MLLQGLLRLLAAARLAAAAAVAAPGSPATASEHLPAGCYHHLLLLLLPAFPTVHPTHHSLHQLLLLL
jgi:hypothetical protein